MIIWKPGLISALPQISTHHPGQISKQGPRQISLLLLPSPSLSLIVGLHVQGKPISIATLLITLCVVCIMELRYQYS